MDVTDSLMRTMWALAIVLGLMVVLAAVVRRWFGGRLLLPAQEPVVRILGSGYVGGRHSIAVIAVAEEIFDVRSPAGGHVQQGRVTDREQDRRVLARPAAGGAGDGISSSLADANATRVACGAWGGVSGSDAPPTEGAGNHGRR